MSIDWGKIAQAGSSMGETPQNQNAGITLGGTTASYKGTPANFNDYYESIAKANEEANTPKPDKKLEGLDYIMANIGKFGKDVRNLGNIQENFKNAQGISKIGAFLPTLITSPLGAIPNAVASGYEALTGHNVMNANFEQGTMPGDDLNVEQKIGAGIISATEAAGPLVGGSARALGAIGKGIGKAFPAVEDIMPAKGMGLIHKAETETGTSEPMAIAKQFVFDVGEEAGEEAIQSVAEDMRSGAIHDENHDVLGKAAEDALWGALGGGIMSAGGMAANKIMSRNEGRRPDADPMAQTDDQGGSGSPNNPGGSDSNTGTPKDIDQRMLPAYERYARENTYNDLKDPGAFTAKVIPGRRGQKINDIHVSVEDLRAMYDAQSKEDRSFWASSLNVTDEQLGEILKADDAKDQLNTLLAAREKPFRVALHRNPYLDKTSGIAVNITEFIDGHGIEMSHLASQFSSGDIDGDTRYITNSAGLDLMYPTELFTTSSGEGASFLEYMPRLNTTEAIDKLKKVITNYVPEIANTRLDLIEDLANNLGHSNKLVKNDSRYSAENAALNMSHLTSILRGTTNPNTKKNYTTNEINILISDMLSDCLDVADDQDVMESIAKDMCIRATRRFEEAAALETDDLTGRNRPKTISGNLNENTTAIDVAIFMDWITSITDARKQSFFREQHALKLDVGKKHSMAVHAMDSIGYYNQSNIQKRIAAMLDLTDIGKTAEHAINAEFQLLVFKKLREEIHFENSQNRIGDTLSVNKFKEAFEKSYNESIKIYNNALKKLTNEGRPITLLDLIEKREIDFSGNKESKQDAMAAMFKMIKDYDVSDFFNIASTNEYWIGVTIDEAAQRAKEGGKFNNELMSLGSEGSEFFMDLIYAKEEEGKKLTSKISADLRGLGTITIDEAKSILNRCRAEYIANSVLEYMNNNAMEYLNLRTLEDVLASPYARVILQGSWKERLSFIAKANMHGNWNNVFELKEAMENGKGKHIDDDLIAQAAMSNYDGSYLTLFIANEYKVKHRSVLLDQLLDFNIPLEDNIDAWKKIQASNTFTDEDLVSSMMRDPSSEMGLSELSQRVTRARSAIKTAEMYDPETLSDIADRFNEIIDTRIADTSTRIPDEVPAFFTENAGKANMKIATAIVSDAATLSFRDSEKGDNPSSGAAHFQQIVNHIQGGRYSFINKITAINNGAMTAQELATNGLALINVLFKKKRYFVADSRTYAWVDAQKIVNDILGPDEKVVDGVPTTEQLKRMFKRAPQLLLTMCPDFATVAPMTEPKVVIAKETDPASAFIDYLDKVQGDKGKFNYYQEREAVRWKVVNDINALVGSAYSVDPNTYYSRKRINEQTEQGINKIIESAMSEAKARRDGIETDDRFENRMKAEYAVQSAESLEDALIKTFAASKHISLGENVNISNLSSTIADPTLAIKLLLRKTSREEIADDIRKNNTMNLNEDQINEIADILIEDDVDFDKDLFNDIDDGLSAVQNISIEAIALMGKKAWVLQAAEKIYKDNVGALNKNSITGSTFYDLLVDVLSDIQEEILNDIRHTSNKSLMGLLFDDDIYTYDKDTGNIVSVKLDLLEQKVPFILKRYGGLNFDPQEDVLKKFREQAEIVNNPTSSEAKKRSAIRTIETLRVEICNLPLSKHIRSLTGISEDRTANANVYADSQKFYLGFEKLVDEIAASDIPLSTAKRLGDAKLPKMYFGDRRSSRLAAMTRFRAVTASITTSVADNGLELNKLSALAILPHSIACNDPGTPYTKEELLNDPDLRYRLRATRLNADIIEKGKNNKPVTITSSFNFNNLPDGSELLVYNKRCTCPICSKHSFKTAIPGYRNVIDSLDIICDWIDNSQENANLRLKKSIESVDKIVAENADEDSIEPNRVNGQGVSQEVFISSLLDSVDKFRKRLANNIYNGFRNVGEDAIPISYEQAKTIARTYTCEVEINFYDPAEDTTITKVLSLDNLRDNGEWRIPEEYHGLKIVDGSPLLIPWNILNAKMTMDIADNRFGLMDPDKFDTDVKGAEKTAIESLTNWSNFGAGKLNIGNYIVSAPLKKFAFPTQMVREDTPTEMQRFLGLVGKYGGINSIAKPYILTNILNKDIADQITDASNKIYDNEKGITITKIDMPSNYDIYDKYQELIDLKNVINIKEYADGFAVAGKPSAYLITEISGTDLDSKLKTVGDDIWKYPYIIVPSNSVPAQYEKAKEDIFKIGQKSFTVLKMNAPRSMAYASNNTQQYSCTSVDNNIFETTIGDIKGTLRYGDSASKIPQRYADEVEITDPAPFSIQLDNLNGAQKRILPASKYKEVLDAYNTDPKNVKFHIKKDKAIKHENAMAKAKAFIKEAADDNSILTSGYNNSAWKSGSINARDCFGFAYTKAGDVWHLMPLYATASKPFPLKRITDMEISNNKVIVSHESGVPFTGDDAQKTSERNRSYKTMTGVMTEEEEVLSPKPGYKDNYRYKVIDYIAYEGRVKGREEQLLKYSIYNEARLRPTTLMFAENRMEQWVLEKPEGSNLRVIDLLLTGDANDQRWNDIASGKFTIFPKTKRNKYLNKAIAKLARGACSGNGVILPYILAPTYETNGKWKAKSAYYEEAIGIFQGLEMEEFAALYNAMSARKGQDPLIPDPTTPSYLSDNPDAIYRSDGKRKCDTASGPEFWPAFVVPRTWEAENTVIGAGIGTAAFGKQPILKNGLRFRLRPGDKKEVLKGILTDASAPPKLSDDSINKLEKRTLERIQSNYGDSVDFDMDLVSGTWGNFSERARAYDTLKKILKSYSKIGMKITKDGKTLDVYKDEEFQALWRGMSDAIGVELNDIQVMTLLKIKLGWTPNDGEGDQEMPFSKVKSAAIKITEDADRGDYFLKADKTQRRISVALAPEGFLRDLYNNSNKLKNNWGTFEDLKEAAIEESRKAFDLIESVQTESKGNRGLRQNRRKRALMLQLMASQSTYPDQDVKIDAGQLLFRASSSSFWDEANKTLRAMNNGHITDEDRRIMEEQKNRSLRQSELSVALVADRRLSRIDNSLADKGYTNIVKNSDRNIATKTLDNMVTATRTLGTLDAIMPITNITEGGGHILVAKAGMKLPFGPYATKGLISPRLAAQVSADDNVVKFVKALSEAHLMGITDEFLIGFQNATDKAQWLDDVYSGKNWFDKLTDKLMTFTSASNVYARQQTELLLERFGQFCIDDDIREQMLEVGKDEDGNPVSYMESMLMTGQGLEWMVDVLRPESAGRMDFLRSLNFVNKTCMAMENVPSIILQEICNRHGAVNWLTTFFATPYFRYVTNFTGRILNWIAPVSSLNYLLVEKLKGNPTLEGLGIERAQIHTNLKNALMADAMHMTIPSMVLLLTVGALGEALQPPEDEDKIIDYREWTWFGMRIAPEWWISDCLGPVMPMACYMKTVLSGRPNLGVLIHGVAIVLGNNPLMKLSDVVDVLVEPDVLASDFKEEQEQYRNALGGEPTPIDKTISFVETAGLSFLGRITTPLCAKTLQQIFQNYEKSYKKVYAQGVEDVDAEAGQIADTEYVDYNEAQIRKLTRRNPVLGWIMDLIKHPDTSYTTLGNPFLDIQGMPNTVYDDQIQRYYMDKYSIMELVDGEYVEKSDEEKDRIALDIIATLESYDDMEALRSKGFMINNQTRAYVSDFIWQIVNKKKKDFYTFWNSAESDPYVLGNGDYWTGRELRNEMYQKFDEDISNYIDTLYYGKLWSDPMKQGVQQYLRENTQYRMDNNGEFFASGFPGSPILPFKFATTDEKKTMGREGDWATPSAVAIGQSTGERSLVPLSAEYDKTIDFDAWEENHKQEAKETSNEKNKNTTSGGYSSSRRSGGRSGGGGGGGSYPNIYSRVSKLNISSPRVPTSSSTRDTQFDYLRPGWETKGSRESYKRSDF